MNELTTYKKTADYLKLQKTQEYISALAQKLSVEGNPATADSLVVTVEAGLFAIKLEAELFTSNSI